MLTWGIKIADLPKLSGPDVAADEDVAEVRAVAELDERLQLGSHKDRNGHDDRQENQEDWTKSGHSGGQLLPVRLKRDGKIKTYSIDLDRSSVGQTTLLTSPKLSHF